MQVDGAVRIKAEADGIYLSIDALVSDAMQEIGK